MCKRDTENMKVAPESVLSNRGQGESLRYALDQVFAEVGVSPGRGYLWEGSYLHTPAYSCYALPVYQENGHVPLQLYEEL